jgi:hypothetical protein
MTVTRTVTIYTDYKSPYAYLAKDLAYELERDFPVHLEWLPYILDIPGYLGSARIDADGKVVEATRNAHQWRRVRYSYMDCRRQANKRGLVIRGTQKIWDSSLAAAGMLYAKCSGTEVFRLTAYSSDSGNANWTSRMWPSSPLCSLKPVPMALHSRRMRRPAVTRWPQSVARQKQPAYSASQPSSWMASCSGVASIFRKFVRCSQPDDRPA